MRRFIDALPGPVPVKYLLLALVILAAVVLLLLIYDWIGSNMLDSGGTIQ